MMMMMKLTLFLTLVAFVNAGNPSAKKVEASSKPKAAPVQEPPQKPAAKAAPQKPAAAKAADQKVVALQVTPVQKVIALLEGMLEKGKKEKHDEQVAFADFTKFCEDNVHIKEIAIDDEKQNIVHFTADIRKERAEAKEEKVDIAKLDRNIATWKGDMRAATKVREMDNGNFEALQEDYSESVDALMNAIQTLKKQTSDTPQHQKKSGLLQISDLKSLNLIPPQAKKAIDVFVQRGEDVLASIEMGAPEASAYEFQSSGVVEMLEKLLNKFIDERTSIEKEEMDSKTAYDTLMKELNAQIEVAYERRGGKAVSRTKHLQHKAVDKAERTDERILKGTDTKYKLDLEATCKIKTLSFEARQKLRADEIKALEKAIKIVSSGKVAGASTKHLPSMLQMKQKKGSAFPQLRSGSSGWNNAAIYLQDQAERLHSHMLEEIAVRVAKDPFVKVKKMLKDLLIRLMEQANEEANHKGWCDTELVSNEQTRKEKTDAVDSLNAEIDEYKAAIAKLTEEISELTKAVAELDAAMAEQTRLRNEEKATNAETVSDAKKAQTAVEQALEVLREFYVQAGEADNAADADMPVDTNDDAFLQKNASHATGNTSLLQHENPEIFDTSYKGQDGEKVLGMLEVILTDFARLEAATKAGEATSQKEYDEFMKDSNVDKAAKMTDIEHKDARKQDDEYYLTEKKGDLDGVQKQLDSALTYFYKLQPSCMDAGVSYENRVLQRQEEIHSLQEALRKLGGETI